MTSRLSTHPLTHSLTHSPVHTPARPSVLFLVPNDECNRPTQVLFETDRLTDALILEQGFISIALLQKNERTLA